MFKQFIKKTPVFQITRLQTSFRFFSLTAARNVLKIELEGSAQGFRQSLKVLGNGHVNHSINVSEFIPGLLSQLNQLGIDLD